jgi:hypothetical protein
MSTATRTARLVPDKHRARSQAMTILAAMFSIGFVGLGAVAVVVAFVQMRRQRPTRRPTPRT